MSRFLARVFLLATTVAISILTMIYGWGISPKSWGIIIGLGFFGHVLIVLFNALIDAEDKKK